MNKEDKKIARPFNIKYILSLLDRVKVISFAILADQIRYHTIITCRLKSARNSSYSRISTRINRLNIKILMALFTSLTTRY